MGWTKKKEIILKYVTLCTMEDFIRTTKEENKRLRETQQDKRQRIQLLAFKCALTNILFVWKNKNQECLEVCGQARTLEITCKHYVCKYKEQ